MARKTKQTVDLEPDLTVDIENITPNRASEILKVYNLDNYRAINDCHVAELANEMREGSWFPSVSSIAIDVNNILLDGQHELAAVVRSGVTVRMIVKRGCNPASKDVVDTHMPRRMKDHVGCLPHYIVAVNVLLRATNQGDDPTKFGMNAMYAKDINFYRKHIHGSEVERNYQGKLGKIVKALHDVHANTSDPFTSWGVRGAIILAVLNGDIKQAEGVKLFKDLLTFRKIKRKSGRDKVLVHLYQSSTRAAKQSTMSNLMSTLVDLLDDNQLPSYTGIGSRWVTEPYSCARDKAQKLMLAVYQAIHKDTRNNRKFSGALTANVDKALGIKA